MSLYIFVAHTGQRLEADPSSFANNDDVKRWIHQQSSIGPARQILMTVRGKLARLQSLQTERELFLYDRDLLSPQLDGDEDFDSSSSIPTPKPFLPASPPDTLEDEGSLKAWQTLFRERRDWAASIARQTRSFTSSCHTYEEQIANIRRASIIAAERVRQNSSGLRSQLDDARDWAVDLVREPETVLRDWSTLLRRLAVVKISPELRRFVKQPALPGKSIDGSKEVAYLSDLIDPDNAAEAATLGKGATRALGEDVIRLEEEHQSLVSECEELVAEIKRDFSSAGDGSLQEQQGAESLLQELETVVAKINRDCSSALAETSGASRAVAALSKTALNHTRTLLPSLREIAADAHRQLVEAIERRNATTARAISFLRRVSLVESAGAHFKAELEGLEIGDDDGSRAALEVLNYIHNLPSICASLMGELVRRGEWVEKVMADSSMLAEEMAVHRDDEERKRKKWLRTVEQFVDAEALGARAIGVDVNFEDREGYLPKLSRQDLDDFISSLVAAGGYDRVVRETAELTKALDAPTKQQVRRTKAFKNGSVHDAAYGRGNSLLMRGDDELVQSLQNDKIRLEDRLKGSESRIRKLEDLLHRQSQLSSARHPGAAGSRRGSIDPTSTSPQMGYLQMHSPKLVEPPSRPRSSASSRRVSANYGDERTLAQRIVQLEAQIAAEKAKSTDAEAQNAKAKGELEKKLADAEALRKDLLANFKTQSAETDTERRDLSSENRRLKQKVEDLEEEFERVIEGRDDDDARERDRTLAADAKIKSLRAENETQRTMAADLELQLQNQREEARRLEEEVEALRGAAEAAEAERDDQHAALTALHSDLAADGEEEGAVPPKNFDSLVKAVDVLGRRAANHAADLRVAVDSARAENEASTRQQRQLEQEMAQLRQEIDGERKNVRSFRERADEEKARREATAKELDEERAELKKLRGLFAEGEKGSGALRARVEEIEKKAAASAEEAAALEVRCSELEESLKEKEMALAEASLGQNLDNRMLRDRGRRAEEVSGMLYAMIDRLTHLLEHIGFNVSREDGAMVVQRVPKASTGNPAANSTTIDPSQALNRSISDSVSPQANKVAPAEDNPPDYLHWALSRSAHEEAALFDSFSKESKAFSLDVFAEAVVRRIKDAEHVARKWQREAKSYRDKAHASQRDGHHKISYRSFREGDLALFLPTRGGSGGQKRSWAAFNVGAPHYFLREQEAHRLASRDWLLARIQGVEERVVDLRSKGKEVAGSGGSRPSSMVAEAGDKEEAGGGKNPLGLSDGMRWFYLDAVEERAGMPMVPSIAKTTVASAHVDASGSFQRDAGGAGGGDGAAGGSGAGAAGAGTGGTAGGVLASALSGAAKETLARNLEDNRSRRSSGNSRKSLLGVAIPGVGGRRGSDENKGKDRDGGESGSAGQAGEASGKGHRRGMLSRG